MLLGILCLPYQLSQYLVIFIKCLSQYNTLIWTAILLYYRRIFNPLNAELNPICYLLALLGGATIVVVSRLRVNHSLHQVQTTHSCVVSHFTSPKNILTRLSNRLFELLSQSVHFRFKPDLLFICRVNNSIMIINNLRKCVNKIFWKTSDYWKYQQLINLLCLMGKPDELVTKSVALYMLKFLFISWKVLLEWETVFLATRSFWTSTGCPQEVREVS